MGVRVWLAVLCLGLASWAGGATVAPGTQYGVTGWVPNQYGSPQAACDAAKAAAAVSMPPFTLQGGTATAGGGLCQFASVYPDGYYNGSTFVGGFSGAPAITSASNGCPAGFVLRTDTNLCTNVNDTAGTGGGCVAGKDQRVVTDPTATGNAPLDGGFGGCSFKLAEARSCTVDGVAKICGVYTSDGSAYTGTVNLGGSSDVAATCPAGKITNVASGVVTCVGGTETAPAIVTTGGQDSSGNPVQVTTKCIGDQCTQSVAVTVGETTTVSQGPVPAGSQASSSSSDLCALHPEIDACKNTTFSAPSTSGLYAQNASGKTYSGVLTDFKGRVLASGFGAATSGFFNVSLSGSCPTWTFPALTIAPGSSMDGATIDVWCDPDLGVAWSIVATTLLLVSSFTAFRWAVL